MVTSLVDHRVSQVSVKIDESFTINFVTCGRDLPCMYNCWISSLWPIYKLHEVHVLLLLLLQFYILAHGIEKSIFVEIYKYMTVYN